MILEKKKSKIMWVSMCMWMPWFVGERERDRRMIAKD